VADSLAHRLKASVCRDERVFGSDCINNALSEISVLSIKCWSRRSKPAASNTTSDERLNRVPLVCLTSHRSLLPEESSPAKSDNFHVLGEVSGRPTKRATLRSIFRLRREPFVVPMSPRFYSTASVVQTEPNEPINALGDRVPR
jgi:hypothetical protein